MKRSPVEGWPPRHSLFHEEGNPRKHSWLGIAKCRECARQSAWWPGIGWDIKEWVASCRHWIEKRPSQIREPLLPSTLPERPCQKVGVDICEFKNSHYLVQVDYFSRYIDIAYLPGLMTAAVIGKMKNFFAQHGVPEVVVSDNGPQFSSSEFRAFSSCCHRQDEELLRTAWSTWGRRFR